MRAGSSLDGAAMAADVTHLQIDGFVSLGVVASAIVVALGAQIADPIIGLTITPHNRQSAGYRDAVRIEVLVVEGCPNAKPAVQLARAVAAEAGVDSQIEIVRINDLEACQAHRFLG